MAAAYRAPLELAYVFEGDAETPADVGGLVGPAEAPRGASPRTVVDLALHRLADASCAGGAVRVHVVADVPETALVDLAERRAAGLLVVGTHGRRGLERLRLGSVASWAARHASCPVLVVPAS